jgi:hypothetical protein
MRAVRLAAAAMLVILATARVPALTIAPTDADVARALKVAALRPEARARFHAPYLVRVDDATVEQFDVVTEFRRYVLVTEHQLELGNWMFSQGVHEARAAVRPWEGRVAIAIRFRFHPQNTLSSIPPFETRVGDPPIEALDVIQTPITTPLSGKRHQVTALLGAVIETQFDAAAIGQTTRPVSVWLNGRLVEQTTIDFSKLE